MSLMLAASGTRYRRPWTRRMFRGLSRNCRAPPENGELYTRGRDRAIDRRGACACRLSSRRPPAAYRVPSHTATVRSPGSHPHPHHASDDCHATLRRGIGVFTNSHSGLSSPLSGAEHWLDHILCRSPTTPLHPPPTPHLHRHSGPPQGFSPRCDRERDREYRILAGGHPRWCVLRYAESLSTTTEATRKLTENEA